MTFSTIFFFDFKLAIALTGPLWSAFQPKLSKIFRANSSGQPAKMLVMCWHKITADQHTPRLEIFLIIFQTFFMICQKNENLILYKICLSNMNENNNHMFLTI